MGLPQFVTDDIVSLSVVEDLKTLGLTVEILHAAIDEGEIARGNCTDYHPPTAPGFNAWSNTVAGIRRGVRARRRNSRSKDDLLGWEISDSGLSTVISPDGTFAIAVAAGDALTGDPNHVLTPSTKYCKGTRTLAAIEANRRQLALFGADVLLGRKGNAQTDPRTGLLTWILLVHATPDEVRSELSLPNAFDADGRVVSWSKRLILPSMPRGARLPADPDDGGGEEDVVVERIT